MWWLAARGVLALLVPTTRPAMMPPSSGWRAISATAGCNVSRTPAARDTGGGGGGGGGETGAWYYSWSCTGECSPGQLAIEGTEGPFPTEDGCNAVRNGDSRKQLVQQPGNVGSVGFCERR